MITAGKPEGGPMHGDAKYFTFPLYVLTEPTMQKVYEGIIYHGLGHVAEKPNDRGIAKAAVTLNMTLGSAPSLYHGLIKSAQERVMAIAQGFGPSPTVRLRTTVVFNSRDCKDHDELGEREFRVLCALYSYLGDKPFSQVALPKLQERAAGCKTRAMLDALPVDKRGPVYSPKEIRNAIDRLHADGKGWFSRVTYRQHKAYYSHRKTEAELIELVAQKESAAKARHAASTVLEQRIAQIEATRASSGQVTGNINKDGANP